MHVNGNLNLIRYIINFIIRIIVLPLKKPDRKIRSISIPRCSGITKGTQFCRRRQANLASLPILLKCKTFI